MEKRHYSFGNNLRWYLGRLWQKQPGLVWSALAEILGKTFCRKDLSTD